MKRILAAMLLAVMTLGIFPAMAGEKFVMKFGDTQIDGHPQVRSYYDFAKLMKEYTNGQVEVQVFPGSALGNHRDMIEGIKIGTLQITKCMVTDLAMYFPEVQVFGLPFIFSGREHQFRVVDGEIGDYFNREFFAREDLVALCWFDTGSRNVYNSKRAVKTVDDMKGLLLRVPENPVYMAALAAFGATGTPMAVGEIYTALQTRVIDGAENVPAFYETLKHFEAAPYYSFTEHIITPDVIIMRKSYLESLPKDIQDAIWKAAAEMERIERKNWVDDETGYIEKLKAAGVQFNDVDKSGFMEASKAVWTEFEDVIGKDLIDRVQALK